jgi:hypothetical protein
MKRLTPEAPTQATRRYVTINILRPDHDRLRAIADEENASMHKVITGLINYYEENEAECEADAYSRKIRDYKENEALED